MFKLLCKHPHSALAVFKDATEERFKNPNFSDHVKTTYHLFCQKCHKQVDITYASANTSELRMRGE